MDVDPNNQDVVRGYSQTLQKIQETRGDKDRSERALQDPEIQEILREDQVQSVLQLLKNDPAAAQRFFLFLLYFFFHFKFHFSSLILFFYLLNHFPPFSFLFFFFFFLFSFFFFLFFFFFFFFFSSYRAIQANPSLARKFNVLMSAGLV